VGGGRCARLGIGRRGRRCRAEARRLIS
jgi:hypothetical protein